MRDICDLSFMPYYNCSWYLPQLFYNSCAFVLSRAGVLTISCRLEAPLSSTRYQANMVSVGQTELLVSAGFRILLFLICKVIQPILYLLYGPYRGKNAPNSTNKKMHSFAILADIKPYYFFKHGKHSFLLRYQGTRSLAYLERPDVSLYSVTDDEFLFVRTKPEVDIYNLEKHSFIHEIQQTSAVELLSVSHSFIFEYLRSRPGRDGSNITYMHNHGRCGSTLVAAMLFKTKQCVVLSEPTAIINLAWLINEKKYQPNRRSVEYLELIRSTFLLTCPDSDKTYFIKPWGTPASSLLPLLKQALPGIREMFMYRAVRPTARSFLKIYKKSLHKSWQTCAAMLPVYYRSIWDKVKCGNGEEELSYAILTIIHAYILESADRDDIKTFSYESLVKNKEEFTVRLLKEVGIGEEYLQVALSALETDSQANSSYVSRKNLSDVKVSNVSDESFEWMKEIARVKFGFKLEGTDGHWTTL